MKKTVYCCDDRCNHGTGNILLVLSGENIFIRHRNPEGGYWEKLTFRVPGINVDFSHAAISQKILPEHFTDEKKPFWGGDRIYIQCRNFKCRKWTELTVGFPGLTYDFTDAAVISEDLPAGYHLDTEPAAVVI